MESQKDIFKALIKEFHEGTPPWIVKRDFRLLEHPQKRPLGDGSALSHAQAVIISGPRRSGKTYCLYQLVEALGRQSESPIPRTRVLFCDFEDDRLPPLEGPELSLLLDAYFELYPDNRKEDLAVVLDEPHFVEGWIPFVRGLLDKTNVRVFLTDSSSNLLASPCMASLAGRIFSWDLQPLNFKEYLAFKGIDLTPEAVASELRYKIRHLLDEYLIYGGFPGVVLSDSSAKYRILKDYFDLIVYRDLVERFGIRNIRLLKCLIKHLFAHVSSTVSLNAFHLGLGPEWRASRKTIMEYLSYLERTDLISLAPRFSDPKKTGKVSPRRVFCLDTGLRNAISFQLAEDEERLAKNAVYRVLKASGETVFYWKERGEVDFLTQGDGRLRGIIVSYGRQLDPSITKPLRALRQAAGTRETELVVLTKDTEKSEAGIGFIPLWKWLLAEH